MKAILISLFFLYSISCPAQTQTVSPTPTTAPKEETYQSKLGNIETARQNLAKEYSRASNKKEILETSRKLFIDSIYSDIFPVWYGTDWDFNGTTETPKEGKIACGYFVTTVLRDAGVRLQRVSLAQQASENIIKSLTTEAFIKRFRNVAIEKFVADVKNSGAGLYVVGLDIHVGFILHDGSGEVWFIHSSYGEPSEVVKEKALESVILSSSKYRVIGKISADDNFILKWLRQTSIPTVRR